MQDLLTLTLETLTIATALIMFSDFFCGLRHLYYACATAQDKPEIAVALKVPSTNSNETAPLSDPWEGEGEIEVRSICFYQQEATPVVHLLVPAQEVVEQPPIDYSDWTIRALKKESQRRKLSKYSSLTKNQLISRLTAV